MASYRSFIYIYQNYYRITNKRCTAIGRAVQTRIFKKVGGMKEGSYLKMKDDQKERFLVERWKKVKAMKDAIIFVLFIWDWS